MTTASGTLYVISAPSGAGKTSLVKALVSEMQDIIVSISYTTRAQREGEVHDKDYHFIDKAGFTELLNEGRFLEHAEVFGNFYGTSEPWVKKTLAAGTDVILEIDWQGAEQVKKLIDCCSIYILPPSITALKERLGNRGQDSEAIIAGRMAEAQSEISHYVDADFLVINDSFDTALSELKAIVTAQRCTIAKQQVRQQSLLEDLLR
jgi:guanylate kinase